MTTFISGDLPRDEALALLTLQDSAIRAFAAEWPAPRWIKVWRDGEPAPVMAWLNGAYSRWYAVDPRQYIGRTDSEVWPPDVCEKFRQLDLGAIGQAGEIVTGREPTPRGREPFCIARKFACRVDDSGVKGWAIYGEICPLDVPPCADCKKENNNGG